jgi:hypothetical protein
MAYPFFYILTLCHGALMSVVQVQPVVFHNGTEATKYGLYNPNCLHIAPPLIFLLAYEKPVNLCI